ncbi:unnamed protein product, partial [Vitis vinifera]|uniref:Uncharacterized protein n=1 Tax=Vitis vinifera TaxID=29760 RepID=D7SZZ5_VITVI
MKLQISFRVNRCLKAKQLCSNDFQWDHFFVVSSGIFIKIVFFSIQRLMIDTLLEELRKLNSVGEWSMRRAL